MDQSYVGCVSWKYFLLVCGFSYSLYIVFHRAEVLNVNDMGCTFGGVSKMSLPYLRSRRFSSMLTSRSFIVSHFTFRSVIHFQLNFLKGVWFISRFFFFFFACKCPVVLAPFLEKFIFAPLYCFCYFVKDNLAIFMRVYF